MPFERSATRVWKTLEREERLLAARRFWEQPPDEALPAAQAALVRALRIRPQSARGLRPEQRAQGLASVSEPGELLAAALLVALHLGERRALLACFLDAAGVPHREGLVAEDALTGPLGAEAARKGCRALAAAYPRAQVRAYLNTLWLQDHDRWGVLEAVADELCG